MLPNEIISSTPSCSKVAVRVRPVLDPNDVACMQVTPNGAILFDEGGTRNKLRRYVYDHVFDDAMSQELVYQKTTAALVKDVLNGFSAAVFAYGSTGSGSFTTQITKNIKAQITYCVSFSFIPSAPQQESKWEPRP